MTQQVSDADGLLSVRDLILHRLSPDDRWNLALVQRSEVWDQVRMRHLLDSMLAGYPIGAILLCRVKGDSKVIRVEQGERVVVAGDPDTWQLLDGQQRLNAFFFMLTREGQYGRFYLHMTMRREPPGPAQSRKTRDRALAYISWRAEDSLDPVDDRHLHVDLTGWSHWAEQHEPLDATMVDSANVASILHELDPEFTATLSTEAAGIAVERLNQLIRAWVERRIPVLRAEVEDAADVLEIFTRINLGGVQVEGPDVYFAAVKTFWADAEARIDRVERAASFFPGRMGALRFLSRLASRGLSQGDLLPLKVDRLAGRQREPLVQAMQELTTEDSVVLTRVREFVTWMRDNSELGYGLRVVTPDLWDEVLGWAAASRRTDDAWYAENLPVVDAYLLGATLFRYPSVMGDRYRRAAFLEALAAGAAETRFPLQQILAVARAGGLTGSRQAVLGLKPQEDRARIADQNGTLLTTLAQRLPYEPAREIDWDHIFPQAQAARMWAKGEGRRRHHRDRRLVNSAGNLWALDFAVNRSLQDDVGAVKFDKLKSWLANPDPRFPVQPFEMWSLTDADIAQHLEVDRLLTNDAASIDQAMMHFREVVTARTTRLLTEALARFPKAQLFATDAATEDGGGDPTTDYVFHEALGITPPPRPPAMQPIDGELDLGPEWIGRVEWLKGVVRDAGKQLQVDPASHALPSGRRGGFDYARWIKFGAAQDDDSYFLFGVASKFMPKGRTPIWIQVDPDAEGWETIEARVASSGMAEMMIVDTDPNKSNTLRLWLPVEAPSHLGWNELVDYLVAQGRQILDVITGSDAR